MNITLKIVEAGESSPCFLRRLVSAKLRSRSHQGFAASGAECLGQSRALIHVEIVDARQRRVFRVRLRLIPVNGGRNIILKRKITRSLLEVGRPITPTKCLDSHAQILLEPNRISDTPAIQTETLLAGVQSIGLDHLRQT